MTQEQLAGMKLSALKRYARQLEVDAVSLEEADDAEDIRGAVIGLIVAAKLREELGTMKLSAIKRRAREVGVREGLLEDADDAEDTKLVVVDLIIKHVDAGASDVGEGTATTTTASDSDDSDSDSDDSDSEVAPAASSSSGGSSSSSSSSSSSDDSSSDDDNDEDSARPPPPPPPPSSQQPEDVTRTLTRFWSAGNAEAQLLLRGASPKERAVAHKWIEHHRDARVREWTHTSETVCALAPSRHLQVASTSRGLHRDHFGQRHTLSSVRVRC
jgi:hypothetical protein